MSNAPSSASSPTATYPSSQYEQNGPVYPSWHLQDPESPARHVGQQCHEMICTHKSGRLGGPLGKVVPTCGIAETWTSRAETAFSSNGRGNLAEHLLQQCRCRARCSRRGQTHSKRSRRGTSHPIHRESALRPRTFHSHRFLTMCSTKASEFCEAAQAGTGHPDICLLCIQLPVLETESRSSSPAALATNSSTVADLLSVLGTILQPAARLSVHCKM